jgi:hypothetical protein
MIKIELKGNPDSLSRAASYLDGEFEAQPRNGVVEFSLKNSDEEKAEIKNIKRRLRALSGLQVSVQHIAALNQMAIA